MDKLINTNRSVALVHDLWNIEKHAELSSAPRSGHIPKVVAVATALTISADTGAGAGALYSMGPRTGKVNTGTTGAGKVQLALVAKIVDEKGITLGDFTQFCTEAAEAWSVALKTAGVPQP